MAEAGKKAEPGIGTEQRKLAGLKRPQLLRVANALVMRQYFSAGATFGGRRSLERALGYPSDAELTYDKFYKQHRRDGLAKRVVRLIVQSCWSGEVKVYEDPDPKKETPFEKAFKELATRTRLLKKLRRLDEVSRIGRYAVLLVGIPGQELKEPLEKAGPDDVQFFSVYSEKNAKITKWDTDQKSPRYGLPLTYELTLADEAGSSGAARDLSRSCHWSRLVHCAENLLEDDVYGEPALYALFNSVLDAAKTIGGSAEAVWKAADRGIVWNMDKDADADDDFLKNMDKMLDEYEHDLRRNMPTKGVTPIPLGSEVPDPSGTWSAIEGIIAAGSGYPRRILFGSERGELASMDDRLNYAGTVGERRQNYCEPDQLRATIDLLIKIGALVQPAQPYQASWPSVLVLSEQEKVARAQTVSQAVRNIADAGGLTGVTVMTVGEFREQYLDLPAELPEEKATTAGKPVDAQPAATIDPAKEAANPEAVKATDALNGAQVSAMIEIVQSVARRELPRETGVQMIAQSFPVTAAEAENIMGPTGKTFFVDTTPIPAPANGNQPPPVAA